MNKQTFITALLAAALALTACTTQKEEAPKPLDDVMMQAFYWDVPVDEQAKDGSWWDHLRKLAPELKATGISSLWTPVPAKGNWGIVDSGYGIWVSIAKASTNSFPSVIGILSPFLTVRLPGAVGYAHGIIVQRLQILFFSRPFCVSKCYCLGSFKGILDI